MQSAGRKTIRAGQLRHSIESAERHIKSIHQKPFCHTVSEAESGDA
jgi:hypothetical protein